MPLALATAEFAAEMARLGPFEPAPRLAIGVSGGPDSMALALLSAEWARTQGGSVLALIVDHGLREASAAEAAEAARHLHARGIMARVLPIHDLQRGPALAERARTARFAALAAACAGEGILHLMIGHHAADQAETVLIRWLGGSSPRGLAAMAPLVELGGVRILRPLLGIPPVRLRALLEAAGMAWADDPSNADASALRPRLRLLRADRDGVGTATSALVAAAAAAGAARQRTDAEAADFLAAAVSFRPEGFALLPHGPLPPTALAAVIQAIGGAAYPPAARSVTALAAAPRPATVGGVRLLPAGSLGPGLLLVREAAAMAPPVAARAGAVWDRRFRLAATARPPHGTMLGALGADAQKLRRFSRLPSAVLGTLPALRQGGTVLAVPHLNYPDAAACADAQVLFSPARSAAGQPSSASMPSRVIGDA